VSTEPTGTAVLQERRGAVLWLRLNRPETLNGLHPAVLADLNAGLDAAEADAGIRGVVITANGRAFCAGADLVYAMSLQDAPAPPGRRNANQVFLNDVRATFARIEHLEMPVIAAVQGITVGGGLELALCCDFIVAARSAKIGDGHANYGQIPGGGGSVRLPRRVGLSFAKRLLFTGELLLPEQYAGTDLITEIVDDEALEDTVQAFAESMAGKSPVGIAHMKSLVNDTFDIPVEVGLTLELAQAAQHQTSQDWHEGITAFNEKRRPVFTGR